MTCEARRPLGSVGACNMHPLEKSKAPLKAPLNALPRPLPMQALVSRETSPTDGAVVTVSRCGSDCCAWGMALVWN